jgi:hypothetical protein
MTYHRTPLTTALILAWADTHRALTGEWPSRSSGPVLGAPGENWLNIDQALRVGVRSLSGGDSLARLLLRSRGGCGPVARTPLTEDRIVAWARQHRRRFGQWPEPGSGSVADHPGETWAAVHSALRSGRRGLPGGDTLYRLLARRCGVRHPSDVPPLDVVQILAWADQHHRRTGDWPLATDGDVKEAPGETWRAIDGALRTGRRGLPGGSSLAQVLAEYRGRRNKARLTPLTPEQILCWAEVYHARTGYWPGVLSGAVPGAPGENWRALNLALTVGLRGLPGGDSLARLLRRHGRRHQRATAEALHAADHRHRPAG